MWGGSRRGGGAYQLRGGRLLLMGSCPSFGRHTCERRYRPESPRWVIHRPRNSMGNSDSSSSPEGWLTSGGSGATRQLQDHVWVPGTNPSGQRAGARQAAPRPAAAAAAAAGARRCRSRSCQGGYRLSKFHFQMDDFCGSSKQQKKLVL